MSDLNQSNTQELGQNDEERLSTLKARADLLGIKYSNQIGAEKLAAKIALHTEGSSPGEPVGTVPGVISEPMTQAQYDKSLIGQRKDDAKRLVRVRVTCMNPNKTEWEGEIISVGSAKAGTFKKYVPFNSDAGYHIPNIMYTAMKERQCTIFYTVKGPRGDKVRKGKLVPEFNIEVMDPLTSAEIEDLGKQQAMSGAIDA